jgi:hypothetical protein
MIVGIRKVQKVKFQNYTERKDSHCEVDFKPPVLYCSLFFRMKKNTTLHEVANTPCFMGKLTLIFHTLVKLKRQFNKVTSYCQKFFT